MTIIPFSAFKPDLTDLDTQVTANVANVVPRGDGYGPFPSFSAYTQALPGACRGYFYAINADASISVFAATATNLYRLNNTDFSWTSVSLGGGPYAGIPSTDQWNFVQFNNFVIAVQVNVVPQVFDLTSSTAFANLGGSPPQARYAAVVNRFLVLSGLLSSPYRVQWSGLNALTTWDNVTNQSNFQDLPDGGIVRGVAGGEFGTIFQDKSIRRMTYAPGAPYIFQIDRVSQDEGCDTPGSIVRAGDQVFFYSTKGFKVIQPGGYPTPIGKEQVDRTFAADLDRSNLQLFIGAQDPLASRVYFAYKSVAGQAAAFDTLLIYDWNLQRWSKAFASGQYLSSLAKPGITLEALDAIAPGIITISAAANNGSGKVRLTISGLTAGTAPSNTNLNLESRIEIYGIVGTTEANGNHAFTIVDPTHIDLTNVNFANAYVSGGAIGGSVDQLAFSLDTIGLATEAQLSGFNGSNVLGFFNGPSLEASIETPEQDGGGRRLEIQGIRVMSDAPSIFGSLAIRDNPQAASVYTAETSVNSLGICPQRNDTRYARAKVRIPAAQAWTYALGVEPVVRVAGRR